jgi:hypothetical protein
VATGALVAAETLPQILLGSIAGLVADRWPRRTAMMVSDLARAGLLLLLLLTYWDSWFWIVFPVAFLLAGTLVGRWLAAGHRTGRIVIAAGLISSAMLLDVVLHAPYFPLALGLVGMVGIPALAWNVTHRTLLQRNTPDEYRGRVFGAQGALAALLGLGGTGLAAALAGPARTVPLLDLTRGLYAAAGLVALVALRR